MTITVLSSAGEVERFARTLGGDALAIDLESDGLFAYRPRVCTVQIAHPNGDVVVVDAKATSLEPLAFALGEAGPIKIVHDVAFDARLLAEAGLELGNVHDTSICARMLGATSTGLATLLASELGVELEKSLQHHDWRERPITDEMLGYLAGDVAHLGALRDALWTRARAQGIEPEVLEETRHRIATAVAGARTPDPRPAWVRLKGIEKTGAPERAILRRLAELREREAVRRDVPPHKVISADALLAIAKSRPATRAQLRRVRGVALVGPAALAFADAMLRAVAEALAAPELPAEELRWLERPRVPAEVARQRKGRESRLGAWRRDEAKRRGVDEQVVLPGHCLKALADGTMTTVDEIARVPGLGAFRAARYGEAIARALAEPS